MRFNTPHTWHNNKITLALHGILIMDEFLQFKTSIIESLRLPMDDYPFMLIAAFNPPDTTNKKELQRFHEKITPPFLDRIELIAKTIPIKIEEIMAKPYLRPEKSKTIKDG